MSKHNNEASQKPTATKFLDKLFGGINFTWPKLILYAVGAAVLTTIFLVFPIFKDTSFMRMGETLEAWILLAIIIIANSKSPLDSALKTFIFFLISQPLIYLFQVPFNWQGWGIFQYYRYWFMLTLYTFPAAFIGWFIKKKNWLSLLILMPMLILLAITAHGGAVNVIHNFPHLIITTIFCITQILIYLIVFTKNLAQKFVGILIPVIVVVGLLLVPKDVEFSTNQPLPGSPILTKNALVEVSDTTIAHITVSDTGEDSSILINAHDYGETTFTIKDGDSEYHYSIRIYEDELGYIKTDIELQE